MLSETISYLPTKVKFDYKTKNINLYYRKKDENDLFRFDIPFKHYIYIEPKFLKDKKIRANTTQTFHLLTNDKPLAKVFMSAYDARNIVREQQYLTGEGDVSPEQRFMCDAYYNTDFPNDVHPRIFYLDIETYTKDGLLPRFNHNVSEINAITLYDTYTELFYCWFLLPQGEMRTDIELRKEILENEIVKDNWQLNKDNFVINFYSTPKKLLEHFMQFIIDNVPDIITAWNAPFDIPYIVRKIYDYFGEEGLRKISPFNDISFEVQKALENNVEIERIDIIPGIDALDMLFWYKKNAYIEQPSYSLKYISTLELGESKIVSESGSSDLTYRYENEFINFCIYNIQDVRLLTLLEDKLKIMNLAVVIRNITKVDFQDILHETMTIDNYFIMEANKRRKNGWDKVLPTKFKNPKIPYMGAYVKPTNAGRYKWIADLDFSALYPSIDRTFNISNETLVGKIGNYKEHIILTTAKAYGLNNLKYTIDELCPQYDMSEVADKYKEDKEVNIDELGEELVFIIDYFDLYDNKGYPNRIVGLNSFHKWLEDNNFVILTNGVIVDHNVKKPMIPTIMSELMTLRKGYKKKMFDYEDKGDKVMAKVYNIYQKGAKVLNNSCFTDEHEVITLDGIKNIKDIAIGQQLINFNYIERKMETDIVVNTICKQYNGFIYNIKKDLDRDTLDLGCYDFSVTNDHKFVVENTNGIIIIKTAEELFNEYSRCNNDTVLYYFPSMNNETPITHDYEYSPLNIDNFNWLINKIIEGGHSFSYWDNQEFDYHFFHTNKRIPIKKENLSRENFTGNVYCITTEKNHTLMAGKNHKFVITHNCYGVVAQKDFRMYNLNVAAGITSCGQSIIRAATYALNNYINGLIDGNYDNVIANDTDSIIFTLQNVVDYPIDTRDGAILKKIANIATDCQNYVNKIIFDINKDVFRFASVTEDTNFLNIKNEWVSSTGLFLAKKNYAINMVFNEGHPKEDLIMMGISIKRSTIPEACKPYIQEVLNAILNFKDKDDIDKLVLKNTEKILELPLNKIGLSISINDVDSYKADQPHVIGTRIWNKYFAKSDLDKIRTAKVKLLFVKKWKNSDIVRDALDLKKNIGKDFDKQTEYTQQKRLREIASAIAVPDEPKYWEQIKGEFELDVKKMKERLVVKNIEKFYTAMNWDMPQQLYTDSTSIIPKNMKKSKLIMVD